MNICSSPVALTVPFVHNTRMQFRDILESRKWQSAQLRALNLMSTVIYSNESEEILSKQVCD